MKGIIHFVKKLSLLVCFAGINFSTQAQEIAVAETDTCPDVDFPIPGMPLCSGEVINFAPEPSEGTIYTWTINDDHISTIGLLEHRFLVPGLYNVSLTADNGKCSVTKSQLINVYPLPFVYLGNDTSVCTTCFLTLDSHHPEAYHSWYHNGMDLDVHTPALSINLQGDYRVVVTDSNGCTATDEVRISSNLQVAEMITDPDYILIYPNPADGRFNLRFAADHKLVVVRIFNSLGEGVYADETHNLEGFYQKNIDLSGLPDGNYFIEIIRDYQKITKRVNISSR